MLGADAKHPGSTINSTADKGSDFLHSGESHQLNSNRYHSVKKGDGVFLITLKSPQTKSLERQVEQPTSAKSGGSFAEFLDLNGR